MSVHSATVSIETRGFTDILDITEEARGHVRDSGVVSGVLVVFVPGATAGVTTIEYETGAVADLSRAIERLAPRTIHYDHDARWNDGNGFAHVRAALMGPSLSVPIAAGKLLLGTWQQIILIDFDNRPRERDVVFQIVGE